MPTYRATLELRKSSATGALDHAENDSDNVYRLQIPLKTTVHADSGGSWPVSSLKEP